jgi:hypothetical protein
MKGRCDEYVWSCRRVYTLEVFWPVPGRSARREDSANTAHCTNQGKKGANYPLNRLMSCFQLVADPTTSEKLRGPIMPLNTAAAGGGRAADGPMCQALTNLASVITGELGSGVAGLRHPYQ